MYITQ